MKYILLFIFIISCMYTERYNNIEKTNKCDHIHIPVSFHFNSENPIGNEKIYNLIYRSDSILKQYGFYINIVSIIFDSPKNINENQFSSLFKLNNPDTINIYFFDYVIFSDEYIDGMYYYTSRELDLHYIAISANASDTTFIHEFGHYFSLNHNNKDIENIMNQNRNRQNEKLHFVNNQIDIIRSKIISNKMIKYKCYEKK